MRYLLIILTAGSLFCTAQAQFRDRQILPPSVKDGIVNNNPDFILGFIDPAKFSMSHSYSLSYMTSGSNSLSVGAYTNSMMYRFSGNLNVQVDASLVHSPFSSFGKKAQDDISGIYVTRAELNYRPWENFNVSVMYGQIPGGFYNANPFGSNYMFRGQTGGF